MSLRKFIISLIVTTLYTAIVNAAAYPNLEVTVAPNLRPYNSTEIGLAKLAISDQATRAIAMLIDSKQQGYPKDIVAAGEQLVNYYRVIVRRLIPNWEPNSEMIAHYVQTMNGKKGNKAREELLNEIENSNLPVQAMVAAGFTQGDFDALIKWDRANQPTGGPNWPNSRSSLPNASPSNPQRPQAQLQPQAQTSKNTANDHRILENRLAELNNKYFQMLGVAIFLLQDNVLNDNVQKVLRNHIQTQNKDIQGKFKNEVKSGYAEIQQQMTELKNRNQLTHSNMEIVVNKLLLADFDKINNLRNQVIADLKQYN